jgi:two-component system, OmpR family, sensor kinase
VPIRIRVAAVFTLALAMVLVLGSWLFISQLSAVMLRSIDSGLTAQLPLARHYLGATGGGEGRAPATGDYVIQVIDAAGRVRGASPETGRAPLLGPAQLAAARAGRVTLNGSFDEDSERFAAAPFAGHPGWVAVAGTSLESYDSTRASMMTGLAVGGAVVVALAGFGAYWLARAALGPVERLRRQAATLSAADAGAGLQVPATRDEIAALAVTMNALLGRLHAALARERRFVADASHELRTPLAVLTGELELAARPGRSAPQLTAAVHSAADEAARLGRITNDLLVLARSDEGVLAVRPQPTVVRDLLERSAAAAASSAERAGVSLAVEAPVGLTALVDPDRIRQAVDNLLDNALRFAPAGSQVRLTARSADDGLVIQVMDAGPGIPQEFLPHAFERFSRPAGDRARSDGGAGLGLAIVAVITAAHGGQVAAANRQEGGAVVTMRIPGAARSA